MFLHVFADLIKIFAHICVFTTISDVIKLGKVGGAELLTAIFGRAMFSVVTSLAVTSLSTLLARAIFER